VGGARVFISPILYIFFYIFSPEISFISRVTSALWLLFSENKKKLLRKKLNIFLFFIMCLSRVPYGIYL